MKWSICAAGLAVTAVALAGACAAYQGDDNELSDGGSSVADGGAGASSDFGGMGGGFDPNDNPCRGHAGETICDKNVAITCGPNEEQGNEQDCGDEYCAPGSGCVLCIDGQFSCFGSTVRACNVGPPLHWVDVTTCNSSAGERCNPSTGACEVLQPIGNGPSQSTGTYYQYAYFHVSSSAFRGGCDVDSYGNYLYVNSGNWYENGSKLDVYAVELLDSDGDTEFEPNQHPDNPDAPGPIETRVLTLVATYDVPGLGMVHHSEIQAASDRVFFLDSTDYASPSSILEYVFATGQSNTVVGATSSLNFAQLGFDEVAGRWYAGHHANGDRQIYSYDTASGEWVAEFEYPDFSGGHMDGIDVVTDPNTGTAYVYVSDMTSDFLGQYKRDRGGSWLQVNLFEYAGTGDHVEGMGFGALNHFWITSGGVEQSGALYEIGGGDLSKYTEPVGPPR